MRNCQHDLKIAAGARKSNEDLGSVQVGASTRPSYLSVFFFFFFFFFTTSVPSSSPYELRARDRQVEKEFAVLECDSGKLLKKTQMHLPVPRTFTVFRSHQCANSFCTTFSDHTDRKVGVFLFTECIVKTGDGQGNVKVFVL